MSTEAQLLRRLEPAVRPAGAPAPRVQPHAPLEQQSFDQLLQDAQAIEPVKLSVHAQQRLDQMGVELSDTQMLALGQAVDKAQSKGANESLMLMQRLGFIVNIPNRTVITALAPDRMNDGIVTNIDSTVWVNDAEILNSEIGNRQSEILDNPNLRAGPERERPGDGRLTDAVSFARR